MTWLRAPAGLAAGALCVSTSAVVLGLAGASPGTATFYRCLLAIPPLIVLAAWERRKTDQLSVRDRYLAVLAGALFAGDMLLWRQAIFETGAGLSTVLINLQVLLVPVLARIIDGEQIPASYPTATATALIGVALTSGLFDHQEAGDQHAWGSSMPYSPCPGQAACT